MLPVNSVSLHATVHYPIYYDFDMGETKNIHSYTCTECATYMHESNADGAVFIASPTKSWRKRVGVRHTLFTKCHGMEWREKDVERWIFF